VKKQICFALACLAVVGFAVLPTLQAQMPPSNITYEAPEIMPRLGPSHFSHDSHYAHDCMTCHHMWDGFSEIKSCAAEGCHDQRGTMKMEGSTIYYAFHKKSSEASCLGCHMQLKKAGEPTGPIGCTTCHEKQE